MTDQLGISPLPVLQEWLLFSEVGQSSPPTDKYKPTIRDLEKFQEAVRIGYVPIGEIKFENQRFGLDGRPEVSLAALASASLPKRQRAWLEHFFAWSIVHLPLQLGGTSYLFDKPKLAREGLLKLIDLGVESHEGLLDVLAACVRDVVDRGQRPQRFRLGKNYFRLGNETLIVPCRDLPLCLFDTWLQREVISSFASMLPGWDDVMLRGRSARDALDHEHQRASVEEAYDLANCSESPEAQAQISEMIALCQETVSEQQQELLDLHLQGHSWDAIAAMRGTNAAQVRQQKHRAVAKMRKKHGDQRKAVTKPHPTRLA